ncbi:MAG: nitroreductase family protein [Verrucomicrobiota bacterium]|jgi:nitroreductase|nr:nitroreductase family protein [Verrucomicrobiota bacterium]
MNETVKTLLTRRSIRGFKTEQINDRDLDTILETAKYAPSGSGRQSPVFVVVQDASTRAKLTRMNAKVMGKQNVDPYYGAPTLILVFADSERNTGFEDACLALGTMLIAAAALDLGACWIHRAKEMFDSEEGQALMVEWGVPPRFYGVGACALGYAAQKAAPPLPRKADYVIRV